MAVVSWRGEDIAISLAHGDAIQPLSIVTARLTRGYVRLCLFTNVK